MSFNIKYQRSNIKNRIFFFIILLTAVFFRFYQLSSVPPSASLDEVSIGYNAYSILKTGADEYGVKLPILLRAYDDWRPALYVYLVIPFIKLFGLNVLSVRLPSVILSVLTVIATYFLVKSFYRPLTLQSNVKIIALLSSFLLAISPWHIYISRLGHEVNAAFAFFIFGMYFFLKKRIYLWIIFFILSFISYQSEKIIIPIIVLGIFVIYRQELFQIKKKLIIAGIISLIILAPFIKETFSLNALIRFKATNIFDANKERFEKQALIFAKAVEKENILGKIIYNRKILAGQIFLENYISHFNPTWLFSNSSGDKHKVPGLGVLYLWEAPFIILGFIFLIKQKIDSKIKKLIILWIFVSPLPAALTTDAPHAMRTFTMLPIPQILGAFGIFQILKKQNLEQLSVKKILILSPSPEIKIIKQILIYFIMSLVFVGSIIYFYKQYFLVFPKTQSSSFQHVLYKAIPFVLEKEKSYNKIIFSNKGNLYQSYMFFLFYSQYDPFLYQKQGGTKSGGFSKEHSFGKYEFRSLQWEKENKNDKNLYIVNFAEIPKEEKGVNFNYLNGDNGIIVLNK